ncbi:hypothetical protein SKAU_G00212630 [Synaphobranchus kaupii]|uniref:Uncharacterized protein n=1 Tax=Synaphobranchus kaupii TaxID=118154 RepID=A0A9Q1F966_SYNKA|nr:hypothetical protein SKAU_G00212630 [Synaphobranchus kaupii]
MPTVIDGNQHDAVSSMAAWVVCSGPRVAFCPPTTRTGRLRPYLSRTQTKGVFLAASRAARARPGSIHRPGAGTALLCRLRTLDSTSSPPALPPSHPANRRIIVERGCGFGCWKRLPFNLNCCA